jgi:hypothetical protein
VIFAAEELPEAPAVPVATLGGLAPTGTVAP